MKMDLASKCATQRTELNSKNIKVRGDPDPCPRCKDPATPIIRRKQPESSLTHSNQHHLSSLVVVYFSSLPLALTLPHRVLLLNGPLPFSTPNVFTFTRSERPLFHALPCPLSYDYVPSLSKHCSFWEGLLTFKAQCVRLDNLICAFNFCFGWWDTVNQLKNFLPLTKAAKQSRWF